MFLGAVRVDEDGTFVWDHTGDNVTFSKWAPHEPNNYDGQEGYTELRDNGWNDVKHDGSSRDRSHSYFCEKRRYFSRSSYTLISVRNVGISPGAPTLLFL